MTEKLYINSKDVQIFTTIKGKQNSNNILVVLHGGPGSGADPLINNSSFKVLEDDHLLVYFDQRGCGNSKYNLENKLSLKDLINDVHNVIEYIKGRFTTKTISLFGGSFGAALGFLYLRYYPNEVEKYIASSPAIYFNNEDINAGIEILLNTYLSKIPRSLLEAFEGEQISSEALTQFFESELATNFIFSNECTSKSLKYTWAITPWFFKETYGDDFLNINRPTLILQGIDDDMFNVDTIRRGIKDYRNHNIIYKEFTNCGHSIFNDQEKYFVTTISKFIIKGCL